MPTGTTTTPAIHVPFFCVCCNLILRAAQSIILPLLLFASSSLSMAQEQEFKLISPNLRAETLFEDKTSASGITIRIQNFLVGPQLHAKNIELDGAAILEIRTGAGTLETNREKRTLTMGTTLQLPEGRKFSIRNTTDQPLIVRVIFLQMP